MLKHIYKVIGTTCPITDLTNIISTNGKEMRPEWLPVSEGYACKKVMHARRHVL